MEEMENIFGNLVAVLTDFASDYGISIEGRLTLSKSDKDFNKRTVMVRKIDLFTDSPF